MNATVEQIIEHSKLSSLEAARYYFEPIFWLGSKLQFFLQSLGRAIPKKTGLMDLWLKSNVEYCEVFKNLPASEQQSKALLIRHFDPKVYELLVQDRSMLDLRLRMVTICFFDIRGFSNIVEKRKDYPNEISDFLKDFFQIVAETIYSRDGVLENFVGDGMMAIFGAFSNIADEGQLAAENAVKCAIEIRQKFDEVQKKWLAVWARLEPQQFDIGIVCGIHTGQTLVGEIGSDQREQFTAVGPNVNFASRLEEIAEKNQILISSTCELRIRNKFWLKRNYDLPKINKSIGEAEFVVYEVCSPP